MLVQKLIKIRQKKKEEIRSVVQILQTKSKIACITGYFYFKLMID